jgi:hypothetical protein
LVKRILPALLCLLIGGSCQQGPLIGTISGTVTLDGKPVEDGFIRMVPADGQSQPADGPVTAGQYSITMPIGDKKVEIYWAKGRGAGKTVDTASTPEQVIQLIPNRYNAETILTCTVAKGDQTKNFELTTK